MKISFYIFLYFCFSTFANATERTPPSIFGKYQNKHEIRFICFDQKDGDCLCPDGKKQDEDGYCHALVVDNLSIKPNKTKNNYNLVRINLQSINTNLHTCDFDGIGNWEKYNDRLLVSGEENEDGEICQVILFFKNHNAYLVSRPLGGV